MDYEQRINEWIQGFKILPEGVFCLYCDKSFTNQLSLAKRLMNEHIETVHHGAIDALLHSKSKYNTLTEKQKKLLQLIAAGRKDQEAANELAVASSTVRHQKFSFREKEKKALFYLAVYQAVFAQTEAFLPIPEKATDRDERFSLSEEEYAAMVKEYFDFSTGTVQLTRWPSQQKKIIALLNRIIEEFSLGKQYSEKEINDRLRTIYFDYLLIRRYLIDYGFLSRTADGRQYWREA